MNRKEIITAIQKVNVPQPRVYIKELRKAYETFRGDGQVSDLLATVQDISRDAETTLVKNSEVKSPIRREDLKLVCFEYVW